MNKDVRMIIKALEAQGFEVRAAKNGHPVVYRDGRRLSTLPATPSDRRSLLNCLAPLKRAGFVPPGSKGKR